MNSIYIEALLFVAVFGGMSIISIIVSKRQAEAYVSKPKEENEQANETQKRLDELLELVDNGLLTNREFQVLKKALTLH